MKKSPLFCLAIAFVLSLFADAKTKQPGNPQLQKPFSVAVNFSETNKATTLYLPNACSGIENDYIEGNGRLSVSVQGKISNGQVSIRIKVDYAGTAKSTLGLAEYTMDGNISTSETAMIGTSPVDIFLKANLKLMSKLKSANLTLGDLGYVTVYPDGTVVNHILDHDVDPSYSHPTIYCDNPAGR